MMKPRMNLKRIILIAVAFLLLWTVFSYSRPIPAVQPKAIFSQPHTSPAVSLPWPAYGQGALAAQGYGVLQMHGEQKAVPMASVTKVITALAVLKQKPLTPGQQGPVITIDSDDVAFYNSYYSQGGSVVKVESGEQISEYQALQALLLPSANNIADTLARWAFGSLDNYVKYTNHLLQGLALQQMKVADASGFSPDSVSSAEDLARLGISVMEDPVLADIIKQESAQVPVAGSINNVNWLLGSDGVVGIKTGNTDAAGGCFLFAAKRTIAGETVTVIGALLQAPDLNTAIKDSRAIVRASDSGFETVKVATKGQVLANYQAIWGAKSEAVAKDNLNILAWRGSKLQTSAKLNEVHPPATANTNVGSIVATAGQKTASVSVILKNNLPGPPWHWRIFR